MSIQAVIFDMDGVLVDSEACWHRAAVDFAREAGKTWTEHDHRAYMGSAPEEWARYMREHLELPFSIEDIIAKVTERVQAQYEVQLPLLPGAVQAVHAAASAYKVALASGSPSELIDQVMDLTGLNKVFRAIVAGNAVKRGKPAPDIYLEAARRIGASPSQCVGVEDSLNGIRSLRAAGMLVIAVPSPSYPLLQEALDTADIALPSLRDFSVQLVQSLN
jgi:mannitol-1-/sugar-/sorbitol-6-/2-deoxyglucose-6-phosphatase